MNICDIHDPLLFICFLLRIISFGIYFHRCLLNIAYVTVAPNFRCIAKKGGSFDRYLLETKDVHLASVTALQIKHKILDTMRNNDDVNSKSNSNSEVDNGEKKI